MIEYLKKFRYNKMKILLMILLGTYYAVELVEKNESKENKIGAS